MRITPVMCGEYEPNGAEANITARIINPLTQDVIEIVGFTTGDPIQAAAQIVARFQANLDKKRRGIHGAAAGVTNARKQEFAAVGCDPCTGPRWRLT
ncbi:MAG: hypothetical protein ACREMQ_09900 [Longimicrobiales bacterium]